ncbi:putative ArsR family transcriptional regulator [Tolypothrix sp. PCC 7601]|nr:putative ArsR family transcriptional regulator [Tolypothrix sp. PCC 7601]BAU04477.1 ArsR family bacterial regulatory protein [Fischerella sp. NIES-3754]BAY95025.1 bacterial regulatory proteins, ArsR family protein [Microchaete diplosiphon NIES-3275]
MSWCKAHNKQMTTCTKTADLKAKLFRGFSDPSRLSILNTLRNGSLTVSEIVDQTGLSQSNVSNHLSCLRCCDLVVRKQQGRFMYYELADMRIAKLLDLADELLADVAKGVRQCSHYELSTKLTTSVQ